jgi:molecular chaperone GrpE (heat shock protein)
MFIENISVFQKSSTNQGEIDMLWEQCDTQKKMIRTLHDEMDNTRNDFNKKLEKYKIGNLSSFNLDW